MGKIKFVSPSRNFFAMIMFAASLGWYASQNTYLDLSGQTFDGPGPHGVMPPCWPMREQHALSATSNPSKKTIRNQQGIEVRTLILVNRITFLIGLY
jgi:hypothetical protein